MFARAVSPDGLDIMFNIDILVQSASNLLFLWLNSDIIIPYSDGFSDAFLTFYIFSEKHDTFCESRQ
jgi:hypothetical protein